jgi:3-oxoacyl-[acyl-carrier-protein] synthase-3
MNAVGMSRIALSLPEHHDLVADILTEYDVPAREQRMFTRIFGLRHSPSWTWEELLDDLLVEAGSRALGGQGADLVLYAHSLQMQEVNFRPGLAQRVGKGLGLPETAFFGISGVACTSMLRSIDLARDFLNARPDKDRVLVLGGDHGAAYSAARVVPRMMVIGDAIGAFTVQRTGYRYRYLASAARADFRFARSVRMDEEEIRLFGRASGENLLDALNEATFRAGMAPEDLDWVIPQLVNPLGWSLFSRNSGIPRDRFLLDLLPVHGHVFGVDTLLTLEHADRTGRLRPGDRCALISIGQGAYFRVLLIEVADES